MPDHNEKFLVLKYRAHGIDTEVYLLDPGEIFEGFGGSRHGLPIKKTASLIVRQSGPGIGGMLKDTEYGINRKDIWDHILKFYVQAAKESQ